MAVYSISFAGRTGEGRELPTRGTVTVSADEVRLETRVPLLAFGPVVAACLLLPWCVMVFLPYVISLGWVAMPADMTQFLWIYIWITCSASGLFCLGILLVGVPLRRKRRVFPQVSLLRCQARAREVVLETADRMLYLTTPTSAEAQALTAILNANPVSPVSLKVVVGRESLIDGSGFQNKKTVRVSCANGELILRGGARLATWRNNVGGVLVLGSVFGMGALLPLLPRSLPDWCDGALLLGGVLLGMICGIVLIACGPTETRHLAITDITDIRTVQRYLTFLAPDANVGERRYTLEVKTPDDVEQIKAIIQQGGGELGEVTCRIEHYRPVRILQHPMPREELLAGRVVLDDETISFLGRFGIPHPRAGWLALLLTLAVWALLAALLWQVRPIYPLERALRLIMNGGMAAVLAILLVYLPATSLLRRLFADRITLDRRSVSQVTCQGREVLLTVSSGSAHFRLSLITATEEEAAGLCAALTAPAVAPDAV